jgi:hypothetical protein
MVWFEVAQCQLGPTADQDDFGAQVAGDAARRRDHNLMLPATHV